MVSIIFEATEAKKGLVHKINVDVDKTVKQGDLLASIITQTMNYDIFSPVDGVVKAIMIHENQVVDNQDLLFNIDDKMQDKKNKKEHTGTSDETPTITEAYREDVINKLLNRQDVNESSPTSIENEGDDDDMVCELDVACDKLNQEPESTVREDDVKYWERIKNGIGVLKRELNDAKVALQDDLHVIKDLKRDLNGNNIESDHHEPDAMKAPVDFDKVLKTDLAESIEDLTKHARTVCEGKPVLPSEDDKQQEKRDEINKKIETIRQLRPEEPFEPVAAKGTSVEKDNDILSNSQAIAPERLAYLESVTAAVKSTPTSVIDIEVDVTELVNLLSIMREPYHQNGIELNLTPFYAKAVMEGLLKYRGFNNSYYPEIDRTRIVNNKRCFLALSHDSDDGLKMPVIENMTKANVKEIASALNKKVNELIKSKKMAVQLANATFTITNFGEFGIAHANVLIPEHHIAAIGTGIIFKRPVVIEKNNISIRDIMTLSLAYHQGLMDLSESSRFLHYVAYLLSNPGLLM